MDDEREITQAVGSAVRTDQEGAAAPTPTRRPKRRGAFSTVLGALCVAMNLAATGTEDMFVIYELPSPTLLRQLNVKIKFFPTILPSGMVLKGLNIIGMPAGGSIRTPNTQTRGIK